MKALDDHAGAVAILELAHAIGEGFGNLAP
jgi:hypothetical protein